MLYAKNIRSWIICELQATLQGMVARELWNFKFQKRVKFEREHRGFSQRQSDQHHCINYVTAIVLL